MDIRHAYVDSPVRPLLVVAGDDGLVGLYFQGYRYTPPPSAWGRRCDMWADPVLAQAQAQAQSELGEYFAGKWQAFDVPAVTKGDEFQEQVWAQLREIPYGERITYGDIAVVLGSEGLAQSMGQAVGRNPVSIVIPCHQVVGAGGKFTGFGGGLEREQLLLDLENRRPRHGLDDCSSPTPAPRLDGMPLRPRASPACCDLQGTRHCGGVCATPPPAEQSSPACGGKERTPPATCTSTQITSGASLGRTHPARNAGSPKRRHRHQPQGLKAVQPRRPNDGDVATHLAITQKMGTERAIWCSATYLISP
ncbi:methylated-DNA--[protein]-cysteine S-methyltransferase [Streptomyces sp. NPDC058067]|uniref:methylated-DNA--[protein]-cysteine S-methyltransferase n=1 Tax=Streptomyces sp. NPDC058067 TaxID=3346324 RepID=UPI0036E3E9F1